VPERDVDRETLSEAVLERLSADAVAAIEAGDAERLEILADVTYDIEAWASVDAGGDTRADRGRTGRVGGSAGDSHTAEYPQRPTEPEPSR